MAATAEASRLTEAHRLAQARLGAQVVAQVRAAWPLLDPQDFDRSIRQWLRVVLPTVAANRRTSATLAANYLNTFRTLETGKLTAVSPALADAIDPKAVTTSMTVTGPASIRAGLARGGRFAQVMEIAEAASARAAMRHVLNGGRETIEATVRADRTALGYARATSGKPCHFCAMLASRGPVYRSEESAGFQAHDGCSCSLEPVYRRDADWPAGARRYQELWQETTRGLSGDEARNAFRQALKAG